jgi:hypothetical protein
VAKIGHVPVVLVLPVTATTALKLVPVVYITYTAHTYKYLTVHMPKAEPSSKLRADDENAGGSYISPLESDDARR